MATRAKLSTKNKIQKEVKSPYEDILKINNNYLPTQGEIILVSNDNKEWEKREFLNIITSKNDFKWEDKEFKNFPYKVNLFQCWKVDNSTTEDFKYSKVILKS
jgi:hypothetical protein